MRLLLVTQDFPPNTGGIETYCFELSKRFAEKTDFFAVLAPSHKDADQFDRQLSYPVYRVPVKNSLLPLLAPLPEVYFSLQEKFDTVLHAQWQTVGASLLSKKLGYPDNIYVSAHARELLISPFYGNGGITSETLHSWRKKLLNKVNGFFPVSEYTASLLKEDDIPHHKIHVVGNGTDPNLFKPQNTSLLARELGLTKKKVILSICRLVPRKGIDLVLKALSEITEERQDIIYLIGGTGPDEQRLHSLISDLKLEKYVRFVGRIPNDRMAEYYSLSDVFVMPASNDLPDVEGFGIVFLEANACGTAVIGSKTGGIPDAVIDGDTGYLIDDKNIRQLIYYLKRLLNNKDLAKKMGLNGRRRVLNGATWDHVSATILKKMISINRQNAR